MTKKPKAAKVVKAWALVDNFGSFRMIRNAPALYAEMQNAYDAAERCVREEGDVIYVPQVVTITLA